MGPAAVRVRLDVNDAQAGVLWRAAGARRFAHNWAVARIKANADQWNAEASYDIARPDRVRPLTYFDLAKLWTTAKPTVAPWAGEHSTWAFLYGIRAAAEAHKAFLKGQRRFPRFKSRHSDGNWYATLCYDRPARVPTEQRTPPVGAVVGVDRGVKSCAVVATAGRELVVELAGVRALREARAKVTHLQRDFSRTRKGSANRVKAAARLARAHARVGAVRADALHTFSSRLTRAHSVIVVEDLATANLLGNHQLAAAIADQGWAELARRLTYKTTRHGATLIVADRWYASSRTCSCCGWVKPKLSLAERTYLCGNSSCHLRVDRDVNAAANLAAWGEAQLAGRTQAGDRHPGGPTGDRGLHACGGSNEPAAVTLAGAPVETGTSRPRTRVA